MSASSPALRLPDGAPWWTPALDNWRLALLAAALIIPGSVFVLPLNAAFWVSLAAAGLVCLALVVGAWGRHNGPLLVAPALALLFLMNIFPLMWSFGLSFFHYRANRLAPPRFSGLYYYEKVLSDPAVWERLQTTALVHETYMRMAQARAWLRAEPGREDSPCICPPQSSKGFTNSNPHLSKSRTLRVATESWLARAMAAIWPSKMLIGRPSFRRRPINSP